jgi:hypothetical protein
LRGSDTQGVAAERTRYFPNWVDISRIKPSIVSNAYRRQLGIAAHIEHPGQE